MFDEFANLNIGLVVEFLLLSSYYALQVFFQDVWHMDVWHMAAGNVSVIGHPSMRMEVNWLQLLARAMIVRVICNI